MKPKKVLYEIECFKDIREVLNDAVKKYPDNPAFIIKHKIEKNPSYTTITYSEFQEDVNKLGTALIDMGLQGKRVAIIGKNRYEWAVAYLAVLNGVGITVPLDKELPAEEIASLLQRSKADAIIFDKAFAETMKEISKQNSHLAEYICMDSEMSEQFTTMEDLLTKGDTLLKNGDERYINADIDEEAMCAIVFTSGTTALSKAAMMTHKNYASNIYGVNSIIDFLHTDVNMAFLPFHHTLGSTGLLVMLSNGTTNVFCDGLKYIQENLKEYKVTVFLCVPLLLEAIYKKLMAEVERQGKTKLIKTMRKVCNFLLIFGIDIRRKVFKQIIDNLGGVRGVFSGAAAIDKEVAKGYHSFGILTLQGYGLTETAPVLTGENKTAIRYGSCGFPIPNVEIKIDNPNEEGIGEIIAKGPNVMLGYYENEEATAEVLKDGWFYTGDLGYLDKDGFLFITGRKKNVIVLKNGKNVYPEELEMLLNMPYVSESLVYGKPKGDDLSIVAKIVYDQEYVDEKYPGISEEELHKIIWKDIQEINEGLPLYKKMRHLVITNEEMIKTTTKKVKRFEEIKKEETIIEEEES